MAITPILVGSHFSDTVNAATFYVADTGDNSTGLSWETAFNSIADAVAASATGDSLWLKAGTYTPSRTVMTTNRHILGGFSGVESAGEFHLRDWIGNETRISGEEMFFEEPIVILGGESTLDGVIFKTHANRDTALVIPPNSSVRIQNIRIPTPGATYFGDGISIQEASATIKNCTFNKCYGGGGSTSGALTARSSTVLVVDCSFTGNFTGYEFGGRGGAASFYRSNVSMVASVFRDNGADEGFCCGINKDCHPSFGGALYIENSSIDILDCQIVGNKYTFFGAGLYARASHIACTRSIFNENLGDFIQAPFSGCPDNSGAGVYIDNCNAIFDLCSFFGNEATIAGAMIIHSGTATFHSCLIYDNSSESVANVVVTSTDAKVLFDGCTFSSNINGKNGVTFSIEDGASVSFTNSIVRNASSDAPLFVGADSVLASYSNIEGGFSGEGNIDEDPLFVGSEEGDYRLQVGSPCIDAASTFGPSQDLDGAPRPVDILGIGRDGPGAFDMGAYEFQLKKSDLDKNGRTDAKDLLLFQEDWYETQQN